MTTKDTKTPAELWPDVKSAGGLMRWVEQTLAETGFAVDRVDASDLSKKELAKYKKSLKAEAAETDRLRRVAWAAYKATHVVYLGDGVFWNDDADFDKYDHPQAEERIAQNRLPKIDSPDDLAACLGIDIPKLRWLTFHREAASYIHYTPFTIPKKSGGARQIWAPMPQLKAAQTWVLRNILERIPVHGAAHGFLPGRSILTNARVHTGSKIVVNMDVKDFFPTVTYPRVKGVFRNAGYGEQVATLLAMLCTEAPRKIQQFEGKTYYLALGPRCLPQGAPTSPAITNIVCLRLDRRLTGLGKKLQWNYTRYADDLTFSLPLDHKGDPKLGNVLGSVRSIIEDEGFELHPKKTRVSRSGARQKVTGLVVNGEGGPRVPRDKRRMLRAAVANLDAGKPLPEGESVYSLSGWAAYIYMTNPQEGAGYLKALAPHFKSS